MGNLTSQDETLISYLIIFVTAAIAIAIGIGMMVANNLLGRVGAFIHNGRKVDNEVKKRDIYECGVSYKGDARTSLFSVKYYVLGIIFLLFDVDVVLLYPWSLIYKKLIQNGMGLFLLVDMVIFLILLLVIYIYLRMRKALDFD